MTASIWSPRFWVQFLIAELILVGMLAAMGDVPWWVYLVTAVALFCAMRLVERSRFRSILDWNGPKGRLSQTEVKTEPRKTYTVRAMFDEDQTGLGYIVSSTTVLTKSTGAELPLDVHVYPNFAGNSFHYAVFIPDVAEKVKIIALIAKEHKEIYESVLQRAIAGAISQVDDSIVRTRQLRFSGLIQIYYEGIIPDVDLSRLTVRYHEHGLRAEFRGFQYALRRERFEQELANENRPEVIQAKAAFGRKGSKPRRWYLSWPGS